MMPLLLITRLEVETVLNGLALAAEVVVIVPLTVNTMPLVILSDAELPTVSNFPDATAPIVPVSVMPPVPKPVSVVLALTVKTPKLPVLALDCKVTVPVPEPPTVTDANARLDTAVMV